MIILLQYETPPIFREESSSADEKEFVSPLLKGNSVTKVNEVWIDIAPRNDGDEKKANVKETEPPEYDPEKDSEWHQEKVSSICSDTRVLHQSTHP